MAVIRPFRAIRPIPERAARVAALPYDVVSTEEAREIVRQNPDSFLRIDKAEVDLPEDIDLYDTRVYEQAAANLREFRARGLLVQDEQPYYYIYRLTMAGRAQTGLVACAAVDDYLSDVIKKHELTRADKEEDRIKHVDYCNAHTGPIFMTYRAVPTIHRWLAAWMEQHPPLYDFVAEDGVRHEAWIIDDRELMAELTGAFQGISSLYIADGHHRSASAVKVALRRREANPSYSGAEEFNYFLAVLFPHDQLQILPYNRVVSDLNGLSPAAFLARVAEKFEIEEKGAVPFAPAAPHTFGLYLGDRWYKLVAKAGSFDAGDPVKSLDVSILQDNLLAPVLGIADPRTDQRIDFIGGIRGLAELERQVRQGKACAFSLYPTTVEQLMAISDAGAIMPPKSTWFEPKLRSGLFIHEL
ncbi:MAG TPA: DUF1015 domain-containing protein [Clostridia bacterium]|nr:DUF1015 domain-containing protein [Clostridia bacterium]